MFFRAVEVAHVREWYINTLLRRWQERDDLGRRLHLEPSAELAKALAKPIGKDELLERIFCHTTALLEYIEEEASFAAHQLPRVRPYIRDIIANINLQDGFNIKNMKMRQFWKTQHGPVL